MKLWIVLTAGLLVMAAGCSSPAGPSSSAPPASSDKAITAFGFAHPAATGTVTEASHAVAVTVPSGTGVTALVPIFTHTGASVSPASGAAQDFSTPVTYTVTAADGSTQAYVVTVTRAAEPATVTVTTELTVATEVAVTFSDEFSTIEQGSSKTVTAITSVAVDSYAWYLDGFLMSHQTDSTVSNFAFELEKGPHSLAVVVKKDGALFSNTRYFVVN